MMIILIITIIMYMMISCIFGALKSYIIICLVSKISKVFILENHVIVNFRYTEMQQLQVSCNIIFEPIMS